MKDVVIKIRSESCTAPEQDDFIEFSTDGVYSFEDGVGTVSYLETDVTGLAGTVTSVEIGPAGIIVDRRGGITSRMVFRRGEQNRFQYETPYGMATMGIDTRKISHSFDDRGGTMDVDYVLNVEHTVVARNKFHMDVAEQ